MTPNSQTTSSAILAALQSCAWIERSGTAIIDVLGADSLDLLHRLSTNELSRTPVGSGKLTVLLTDKARIIDVVAVLVHATGVRLVGSSNTADRIIRWMRTYIITDDAKPRNVSETWSVFDILGPRAADATTELTGVDASTIAMSGWFTAEVNGVPVTVVRIPALAELTYRFLVPAEHGQSFRNDVLGANTVIPELTSEDYTYLRVRAGMGESGAEWTDAYNPLEAGLLHLTSFTKGCYLGQEVIARLDSYNKVKQRLMGFEGSSELLNGGTIIVNEVAVGTLTTVVPSHRPGRALAIGYIRNEHAHEGSKVIIRSQTGDYEATVRRLPQQDELDA